MKAVINLGYLLYFCREYEKKENKTEVNLEKIKYLKKMGECTFLKTVLAGYPLYGSASTRPNRSLLSRYGMDGFPAIDDNLFATYCPIVFANIAESIGVDISRVLQTNPKYPGKYDTQASFIHSKCVMLSKEGELVKEVTWRQAQEEADKCRFVGITCAALKQGYPAHVAVVAPMIYAPKTLDDMWCAQAGAMNGIFKITEIFNGKNGVTPPRFFIFKDGK